MVVKEFERGIWVDEVSEDSRVDSLTGLMWRFVGVSILLALISLTKFCLWSIFILL